MSSQKLGLFIQGVAEPAPEGIVKLLIEVIPQVSSGLIGVSMNKAGTNLHVGMSLC